MRKNQVVAAANNNGKITFQAGISNAFGLFQAYYTRYYLPGQAPSTIAWIGSTQLALVFGLGVPVGRLVDLGFFRVAVDRGPRSDDGYGFGLGVWSYEEGKSVEGGSRVGDTSRTSVGGVWWSLDVKRQTSLTAVSAVLWSHCWSLDRRAILPSTQLMANVCSRLL